MKTFFNGSPRDLRRASSLLLIYLFILIFFSPSVPFFFWLWHRLFNYPPEDYQTSGKRMIFYPVTPNNMVSITFLSFRLHPLLLLFLVLGEFTPLGVFHHTARKGYTFILCCLFLDTGFLHKSRTRLQRNSIYSWMFIFSARVLSIFFFRSHWLLPTFAITRLNLNKEKMASICNIWFRANIYFIQMQRHSLFKKRGLPFGVLWVDVPIL